MATFCHSRLSAQRQQQPVAQESKCASSISLLALAVWRLRQGALVRIRLTLALRGDGDHSIAMLGIAGFAWQCKAGRQRAPQQSSARLDLHSRAVAEHFRQASHQLGCVIAHRYDCVCTELARACWHIRSYVSARACSHAGKSIRAAGLTASRRPVVVVETDSRNHVPRKWTYTDAQ